MTWAILAFLSHLIFIPGLMDGFSLPKRVYVFSLGIAAVIFLFSKKRELPLVGLISSYLVVSVIPYLWIVNAPVFIERIALDVAGFAVFWAVAVSNISRERIHTVLLVAIAVAVTVLAVQHFFPLFNGTMGNRSYSAFVAAQAVPLFLAGSSWAILLSLLILPFSSPSRAALAAAVISLVVFGIARKIFSIQPFFYVAVLVVVLSPIAVHYNLLSWPDTRKATWQNSVQMIRTKRDWIFGIGRGQFEIQYPAFANRKVRDDLEGAAVDPERKASLTWGHPHNEFLNSVIETGVLGAGLFLSIILFLIRPVRPFDKTHLAIACSLLGTVLFSAFWFPFTHPSMAITFWALAGMLWSNKSSRDF